MKKIGQIFKYRGRKLITIEEEGCDNCFMKHPTDDEDCNDKRFSCSKHYRKDQKPVAYKLIPFKFGK